MNRHRWLTAGAALLVAAGVQAQAPLPPDINFFGGNLPALPRNDGAAAAKGNVAVAGDARVLVFGDGRELRGELVEITPEEILWRRADAREVLHFPRRAVRRIATESQANDPTNAFAPGIAGNPVPPPNDHATLKLAGGDWLCGNVTSADGQRFTVQLDDGTRLPMAREQIEWIHFGPTPVAAFGFSGSALDMEGWLPACARMELAAPTLLIRDTTWIGRHISPPNNFEVSFELPENSEEGTRLWLQPFGPQINCYGNGTALIRFGRKDISHMLATDKLNTIISSMPAAAWHDKGPAKYRVFYEGTAKRVIVQRNGLTVGDWKYFTEKDQPAEDVRSFQFAGLCFDRDNFSERSDPLQFNRLQIRPWDGTLPKDGENNVNQDRLSMAGAAEIAGRLGSMTDKELVFSGVTKPRQAGSVLTFSGTEPAALTGAEAKLEFGSQGEFVARKLEVRDGKVRCETSFSSVLELPLNALQNIAFPAQAPLTQSSADSPDMLVFKNTNELPGKALSASLDGPVRWRTAFGQEVEFQPARIAGLRLAGTAPVTDPKAALSAATVELRSGERLRGKLVEFDEKHLQLEHPLLGSLGLDRSRLWHLFPVPRFGAIDGMRSPDGWTWTDSGGSTSAHTDRCIYLDGTYVLRSRGYAGNFILSELPAAQRVVDPGLERFEIRAEANGLESIPNFMLLLADQAGVSLRAMFSYNTLQLSVLNSAANRRSARRTISLGEKLGEMNSQRSLRLFVDTKAGTCDLVINGVHIVRLGQEAAERLPPAQYTVKIQPYPNQRASTVFSNIWIGPWNGELPSPGNAGGESTALTNGDVAKGTPKALHDGKFTIDSDLGDLDLPVEKTLAVDFGGTLDTQKVAARLRLADGTIVNMDRFQWDGREWAVHSATFGDLRLPGGVVSELVYDPAPAHVPAPAGTNKLAQKNPGEPTRD
ncbi:MAG: hypothetical protein P4L99_27640 [Chthoniobacter sp.]|nr:hypothetical protein [Chthoniobacter sp.]